MSGYPSTPGNRGIDTSIEAGAGIAEDVPRLQRLALGAIREAGRAGLTTDELAARLHFEPCSIQPRTSELRAKKLIADSGQRRRNARAKRVIVWVAPEYVTAPKDEGRPMTRAVDLVSLAGRGWPVMSSSVAVVRLRDRPGFAVGVQDRFRGGGVGRVWLHLRPARRRAAYLAALHQLPIVESL